MVIIICLHQFITSNTEERNSSLKSLDVSLGMAESTLQLWRLRETTWGDITVQICCFSPICSAKRALLACKKQKKEERTAKKWWTLPCSWPIPLASSGCSWPIFGTLWGFSGFPCSESSRRFGLDCSQILSSFKPEIIRGRTQRQRRILQTLSRGFAKAMPPHASPPCLRLAAGGGRASGSAAGPGRSRGAAAAPGALGGAARPRYRARRTARACPASARRGAGVGRVILFGFLYFPVSSFFLLPSSVSYISRVTPSARVCIFCGMQGTS